MVGGIALLGVITGSFATWFVASIRDLEEEVDESGDEVTARLDEVLVELRLLSTRVRELESSLTRPDRPDQVSPDGAGA
jgi:voltage-gated potassium channel